MNAILNKNCAELKGSRMYVALFPCNECAKFQGELLEELEYILLVAPSLI